MKGLSKRQVGLMYGFNLRLVETLIECGELRILPGCTPRRPRIDPESLRGLREGEHFVVCRQCGAWVAQATSKHLKACSGTDLDHYKRAFPDAPLMSSFCASNKAKTATQRQAQSEKLRARFCTPEGEKTRGQISAASKAMQAGPYGQKAAAHLRAFNEDPANRAKRRDETSARWQQGDLREAVEGWHRDNRERSLQSAAHARRHIRKKYTKLHQRLRKALQDAGVVSQTEHEVGFYSIDEAVPELKLAIEADGCYWHGCASCGFAGRPEIHRYDKAKMTYLTRRGWEVLRFPGHEILANPTACARQVVEVARQRREGHA